MDHRDRDRVSNRLYYCIEQETKIITNLVSVLLAVCMLLVIAGCNLFDSLFPNDSSSSAENTDNSSVPTEDDKQLILTKNTDDAVTLQEELYMEYSEYINYRNPLLHTYGKLEAGKTVNVVYFGGSMTNGTGSSNGNYNTSVEGELVIPFFGTEWVTSTSVGDKASVFEYSIDGKDYVKKNFYNNGPFKVVSDLEAGEHILKIKVSFAGITETYLKNTLKGVIKIGIVMTRDAMQASVPW